MRLTGSAVSECRLAELVFEIISPLRLNALPVENETKEAKEEKYRLVASRHAVQAMAAPRGCKKSFFGTPL